MSYPPQLAVFLERLSGYSSNIFKLEPQGSNSAKANNIIRVTLPANAICDLRSFKLAFHAKIESAGGTGRLPNKIDSLVERVEVSFGGVQVSSGNNFYNVLRHAKDALMGDKTCPALGHPNVLRESESHQIEMFDTALQANAPYCISSWEGFLGSVEPHMLDLSLLPECVVSIYLADNSVCVDAAGQELPGTATGAFTADAATPNPVYALSQIYATIEVIGMADGLYDSMISAAMSQGGGLELPYKQYVSFQDTTNTMRFSVATQSLDRVWIVMRESNFNSPGGAVNKVGTKMAGAFVAENDAGSSFYDVGVPHFEQPHYNGEQYLSKYFNFPRDAAGNRYQLQMNGALYPQFQASYEDWVEISKNSVLGKPVSHELRTLKEHYSVFCARFNLKDCEFQRLIAGTDTRGIALNSFFNVYGDAGGRAFTVFCEMTSSLRIGRGLQLEVVQ